MPLAWHRLIRVHRAREGRIIEVERRRRAAGSHFYQVLKKTMEKPQDQIAFSKSLKILLLHDRRSIDWVNQAGAM